MPKVSQFAKFLGHYAAEARWIGSAIGSLASRFMEHDEQRTIAEIARRFSEAADSIEKTLSKVDDHSTIKVTAAQIRDAIKGELPGMILAAVQEERKKWDAEQAAKLSPPA